LLNDDLESVSVVDPTVIADVDDPGEERHASLAEFPAAATTTTPYSTAISTASFNKSLLPTPRLMLTTHRAVGFAWQ
jgi:hypothetical protein